MFASVYVKGCVMNKLIKHINALKKAIAVAIFTVGTPSNAQHTNPNNLPPCPNPDFSKKSYTDQTAHWNNCWGTINPENSGLIFSSEFKNGYPNGHGIVTTPDGGRYTGSLKNGRPHGHGRLSFPEGHTLVGDFKDGKMHGYGSLIGADGTKVDGMYFEGKLVEQPINKTDREEKTSHPWRVQARCAIVDCQITRVQEYDRTRSGVSLFTINYKTSRHIFTVNIECGSERSNKFVNNHITANCF